MTARITAMLAAPLALTVALAVGSRAQIGDATATPLVVADSTFAASNFKRYWWGDHYRDAWTTPIHVPYLDLQTVAGGLNPTKRGGGMQTQSLRFRGRDGREYAFRAVNKDPSAVLPLAMRGTMAIEVLHDQMSSVHPAAALVADSLLDVAGVLHSTPYLVVMPDDPVLGEFQADFAGKLGIIEERPDDNDNALAAFAGAERVVGSDRLFEEIEDGPDEMVNSRAFLNARLLDFFLGDWDRHRDQWRWAMFGSDSTPGWRPIPRDRDQVFAKFDGVLPSLGSKGIPQLATFGNSYPPVVKLHWNGRELDRRFLVDLERETWDSIATSIQSRLTDETIEGAVGRLPDAWYGIDGEFFATALEHRRDSLPAVTGRFYEFLAQYVDVHATDEDEYITIRQAEDGTLDVAISLASPGATPYFHRRFHPEETREMRLWLHGGDDALIVESARDLRIHLYVTGGGGNDEYTVRSPNRRIHIYDSRGRNTVDGRVTINTNAYERPNDSSGRVPAPRDWGGSVGPTFALDYNSDYGLLVGAGVRRVRYGFRRDPYASKTGLSASWATANRFAVRLDADLRRDNSPNYFLLPAYVTQLDVLHYFGLGNDTPGTGGRSFHGVKLTTTAFEPSFVYSPAPKVDIRFTAVGSYSVTSDTTGKFIGTVPDLYGTQNFGQIGATLGVEWSTYELAWRFREDLPDLAGVTLRADGALYPGILDVTSTYGLVDALAAVYVPVRLLLQTQWAFRAGGRKVWGDFPWFHSAFIGGVGSGRGWPVQRFAGDASLFGNAELRIQVVRTDLILPSVLGLNGLVDVGRVWFDGDSPGGWHPGYGGGLWLGLLGTTAIISATYATTDETSAVYVGFGFMY